MLELNQKKKAKTLKIKVYEGLVHGRIKWKAKMR
jgi:hypothetical protein